MKPRANARDAARLASGSGELLSKTDRIMGRGCAPRRSLAVFATLEIPRDSLALLVLLAG
jgi:hypothetical protein